VRTRGLLVALAIAAGPVLADEAVKVAGSEVPVPKRVKFVAPEYPIEAQARGLRGIVILDVTIDTKGQVSHVEVTRSVPPFDDAAVAAVRQWEYEVTRVDGKPVAVRLTVPITFALKLPDIKRDTGIPELRQGAAPASPASDSTASHVVLAELTIDGNGLLVEGGVLEGDSPWSEALLLAVRTWRFAPTSDAEPLKFKLKAEFVPASAPDKPARVSLELTSPQKATIAPAAADAGAAPGPAAAPTPPAPPSEPAAPSPSPAPEPTPPPSPAPTPAPTPAPSASPQTAEAPPTTPTIPLPRPSPGQAPRAPEIEVISPAPPPPAPAAPAGPEGLGVSAVRDVKVDAGLPDLVRGRRPMVPPFARMDRIEGTVELKFAVDSSGGTSHVEARGPELLRDAAAQTVQSWAFRRTKADRLYLFATFVYAGDLATATVTQQTAEPAPAPVPAP
jgi:TonB family protein